MTEHLTMNTIVHAAFRRDLGRFDEALAEPEAASATRAGQLASAWDHLAEQLRQHHHDEETIFFPAFRELEVDEALVETLEREHAGMLGALDAAGAAMRALLAEPSAEGAAATREGIGRLAAVVDEHLAHEERDLEPFAARHAGTPELRRATVAVRKAHKGRAGTFFAWLTDGADPSVVPALHRDIPPPVLFVLRRVPGRRYSRSVGAVWT